MNKSKLKKITGARLFLPIVCLSPVLLLNVITTPDFFQCIYQERRPLRIHYRCYQPCLRAGDPGSGHDSGNICLRRTGYQRRRCNGSGVQRFAVRYFPAERFQLLSMQNSIDPCSCGSSSGISSLRRVQRISGSKAEYPAHGGNVDPVYGRHVVLHSLSQTVRLPISVWIPLKWQADISRDFRFQPRFSLQ